jgi:hypothetical protein
MVSGNSLALDMSHYELLSEARRCALKDWISNHVDDRVLWSYTSLGIQELFERHALGFRLSHCQFKAAMVMAGYSPAHLEGDVWVFATASL